MLNRQVLQLQGALGKVKMSPRLFLRSLSVKYKLNISRKQGNEDNLK